MKRFILLALFIAIPVVAQPASMDELAIQSHGARMNGLVYLAAGAGPHPVVVFLHGYPGNEKNLDLAQAVRRAGFDALYFDYRGMWGSGGTFSFAHGLEDAQTALAWVHANAAKYHFDTRHITIVGHSFGGWVALLTAPHEPPSTCVVAMAGGTSAGQGSGSRSILLSESRTSTTSNSPPRPAPRSTPPRPTSSTRWRRTPR